MGKRLDQLNLGDSGPAARDDLAIARRTADRVAEELRSMEDDPRYGFCWGKLVDMRITIEQSGRVTEGQRDAIHNIKVGAQRFEDGKARGRGSRRYEGFDDRNR